MKPDCLKLKSKRAAEEADNTAAGVATKAVDAKEGASKHAHSMLVDEFWDFNTGSEDHSFFLQVSEDKFSNLHPSCLLLDSKSTIDIIANKAMVSNISKSPSPITLHCNAGSRKLKYTANLNGYGRVWYDPKAIANILSLSHATSKYRVVFDSEAVNCFRMMLPGRDVVFNVSTKALYYHDTVD